MIITEQVEIGGVLLAHTYSDAGVKIHGGFPESNYDESYDPAELNRTFTETNIPIEDDITAEELLNILTGEES